jgi:hypothetical protein
MQLFGHTLSSRRYPRAPKLGPVAAPADEPKSHEDKERRHPESDARPDRNGGLYDRVQAERPVACRRAEPDTAASLYQVRHDTEFSN